MERAWRRSDTAQCLLILACVQTFALCAEPAPDQGNGEATPPPDATAKTSTGEAEAAPAAVTVELAETPHEAFSHRRPVQPSGTPQPGDPEYPRVLPSDGDDISLSGGTDRRRIAIHRVLPFDPEYDRRWPSDPGTTVAQVSPANRPPVRSNIPPRFVLGEGPDEGDAVDWFEEPEPETPQPAAPVAVARAEPRKLPENLDPRTRQRLEEVQAELQRRRQNPNRNAQDLLAEEVASLQKKGVDIDQAGEEPTASRALSAIRGNKPLAEIVGLILDTETRMPMPARVRIVDATNLSAEARLQDVGFWCNGRFRVTVVAGDVKVEVSAGRFCTTFSKNITIPAGTSTPLEITLLRPKYLRFEQEGWYQADLDWAVRTRRGEQRLWTGSPPDMSDALLVARAEGLHIVGIGLPEPRSDLAVQTATEVLAENEACAKQGLLVLSNFPGPRHSFCGCALGVGVTDWGGIPRYMGDPRQPLMDCMDALRQGGGLTLFSELRGGRAVNVRSQLAGYFQRLRDYGYFEDSDTTSLLYAPAELPYDTVAGPMYDALAFDGSEAAEAIWFNLLNQGYPIPIVGAEGSSLEAGRPPFGQTFVKTSDPLTRENVLKACREGRSMVSFGPVVFADVVERARGPGDRLPSDGRQLSLRIRCFASLTESASMECFDILRNGEVVYHEKCEQGMTELYDFRFPLNEKRDAWYVVRLTEVLQKPTVTRRQAWTNPIFFDTQSRQKPKPAQSRVHGTMRRVGGAPLAGTITVLEPGEPDRECRVGLDGRFDLQMRSAGTLVFAAPGYEPNAWKPIQHPKVQRALGAIQTERNGMARRQLVRPTIFSEWRYLLADLDAEVEMRPRPAASTGKANPPDRPATGAPNIPPTPGTRPGP